MKHLYKFSISLMMSIFLFSSLSSLFPVDDSRGNYPLNDNLSHSAIHSTFFTPGAAQGMKQISVAMKELKSSLDSIKEFGSFFTMVMGTIGSILSFIGFKAILIIIAAYFISSFLSILGFQKNKKSFLLAILIIDAFWLIWIFKHKGGMDSAISLLKTNGIIFLPSMAIIAAKQLFTLLWKIIKKKNQKGDKYLKDNLLSLSSRFLDMNSQFVSSINNDILNSKDETICLSESTLSSLNDIENLVNEFKTSSSSIPVSQISKTAPPSKENPSENLSINDVNSDTTPDKF